MSGVRAKFRGLCRDPRGPSGLCLVGSGPVGSCRARAVEFSCYIEIVMSGERIFRRSRSAQTRWPDLYLSVGGVAALERHQCQSVVVVVRQRRRAGGGASVRHHGSLVDLSRSRRPPPPGSGVTRVAADCFHSQLRQILVNLLGKYTPPNADAVNTIQIRIRDRMTRDSRAECIQ